MNGSLFRQTIGVAGLQGLQMLLSAAIGFLIIRSMSKAEYAMFSLLNVGMATLVGWASVPMTAIFIPYANRLSAEHSLRRTTAVFRLHSRPVAFLAVVAAMGLVVVSGMRNGWISALFVGAMVLGLCAAWLQYRLAHCLVQLRQLGLAVAAMGVNVVSELTRLGCVLLVLLLAAHLIPRDGLMVMMMLPAIAAALLASAFMRRRHPEVVEDATLAGPAPAPTRDAYWELLRPILFSQYFFMSMQLVKGALIYLISPTDTIADVAALGRLMMLLALIDKTVDYLVFPRLGRAKGHTRFVRLFGASLAALAGALLLLCLSVYWFPGAWLWILGGAYQNLEQAVLIAVIAACVERLSGFIMFGMFARGMTANQWWVPLVSFAVYFTTIYLFGLDTALHATWSLLAYALAHLVCQVVIAGNALRSPPGAA